MKKIFFILPVLSSFLLSCVTPPNKSVQERNVPINARSSQEPIKRVFVLPFIDRSIQKSDSSQETIRNGFVADLLKTGEFVIIKNSDFPKDLKTLRDGDSYNLEEVAKVAQELGVNAIIEGTLLEIRIRRLGDEIGLIKKTKALVNARVQVRAYSTENPKEIFNQTRNVEIETMSTSFAERKLPNSYDMEDPALSMEAVQKAFKELVPPMVLAMRKLSWSGRIAMVRGEKIYINAGRLSGIQIGDLLKVIDGGQDIFDPQTGNLLGHAEGRMKGTIEIVNYFGRDGAVGIIHSGAGFSENDKVELY